jgi:hypothetical protein
LDVTSCRSDQTLSRVFFSLVSVPVGVAPSFLGWGHIFIWGLKIQTPTAYPIAEVTHMQISKEIYKRSQSVYYVEIRSVTIHRTKHKLRVHIKSNAYEDQSHSKVERWTGSTWSTVHSLGKRETPVSLYARRNPTEEANFKADRDELLRVAREILA